MINGTSGSDTLDGTSGDDTINGLGGNDTLNGLGGNDSLNGGDDDDVLNGGAGNDTHTGGAGCDDFLFDPISAAGDIDVITDFALGDSITIGDTWFSEKDPGTDLITFIGLAAFSSTAGEVRYSVGGGATLIEIDVDGDGIADQSINITNGEFTLRTTTDNGPILEIDGAFGTATAGDDKLIGSSGFDSINGDAGNDVIRGMGGTDLIFGGAGDDTIFGGLGNDIIDGGADTDLLIRYYGAQIDVSVTNQSIVEAISDEGDSLLNIEQIVISNRFAPASDDTIDGSNATIELDLQGGAGDDIITGGSEADNIEGDTGDDTLTGGIGADTFDFDYIGEVGTTGDIITDLEFSDRIDFALINSLGEALDPDGLDLTFIGEAAFSSTAGEFRFTRAGGQTQIQFDEDGDGTADRFVTITAGEFILVETAADSAVLQISAAASATAGADSLVGSNGDDTIDGLAGNDTIQGLFGDDSLIGGADDDLIQAGSGNDTLNGGTGADTLEGGDGNDTLIGGAGADTIDGGDGNDTADYSTSASAVQINLNTSTFSMGDAQGDDLNSIEGIVGSAFDDTLIGQAGQETLFGGDGADEISGLSGIALINGGAGADLLDGGAGADTIIGGAGDDTLTYENSTAVSVDLGTGAGSGGDAQGDSISSIENVFAGSGNDTLIGNASGNHLSGAGGADSLDGASGDDSLVGGDENDTLSGGTGDDTLVGGAGIDIMDGGFGADRFVFGSLADINSGSNEILDPEPSDIFDFSAIAADLPGLDFIGNQAFSGGTIFPSGIPEMRYVITENGTQLQIDGNNDGTADYLVEFGAIVQLVETAPGSLTLEVFSDPSATAGNDYLVGSNGDDVINGLAGNDEIRGLKGNDTLSGDEGNDQIFGLEGSDVLNGGDGNDSLFGGAGNDTINGGANDDVIFYGSGNDSIDGGSGTDEIDITGSDALVDLVIGSSTIVDNVVGKTDTFSNIEQISVFVSRFATAFDDTIDGSMSDAQLNLFTGAGDDIVIGGSADDTIEGVTGNDTLTGGAGADIFDFDFIGDVGAIGDVITDFQANDFIDLSLINTLGEVGGVDGLDLVFIGANAFSGSVGEYRFQIGTNETVVQIDENGDGNSDRQIFITNGEFVLEETFSNSAILRIASGAPTAGNDFLVGTSGPDTIDALGGDDTVQGFGGNDTLLGNAGNDVLDGGSGADSLDGGAGFDTASYETASGGVTVRLSNGTANSFEAEGDSLNSIEALIGSSFADLFVGSDNANTFTSGAGNDTISTGNGDNYVNVGDGDDRVVGGTGRDIILGGNGNDRLFGRDGNDRIFGGDGNDALFGNANADILNGEDGDDAFRGLGGNDRINGGLGDDSLLGHTGRDIMQGNVDNDILDAGEADDQLFGDEGNDTLFGRDGDDVLEGGDGDDLLTGNRGSDTLTGGLGDDTVTGNGGNDVFNFALGDGNDTFVAFTEGAGVRDVIQLSGFGAAFDTFAEVLAAATDDGMGNTVIDFGGGDTITILGDLKGDLDADDFVFI